MKIDGEDLRTGEAIAVTRDGVVLVGRYSAENSSLRFLVPAEGAIKLLPGDAATRFPEEAFRSIEKLSAIGKVVSGAGPGELAPAMDTFADIVEETELAPDMAPLARALAKFAEALDGGKRPTEH